jgi:cell division protein FtsB
LFRAFRARWRWLLAPAGVCCLAVWILAHALFAPNGWMAFRSRKTENHRLQQQVRQLQVQNEELEHHVRALRTDPKAIEKEAREGLGWTRPGEVVYTKPPEKPPENRK